MPAALSEREPIRRAIVLAAGRGARMRPLTEHTPKPLLQVHGKPLIAWHLLALAQAGVRDVVINTGWLWEQFEPALGDGARFGLRLHYSHEARDFAQRLGDEGLVALETAGGIARALPLLATQAHSSFYVIAGDVFIPQNPFFRSFWPSVQYPRSLTATKFDAQLGLSDPQPTPENGLAYIGLVPNPAHNPAGDFCLDARGCVFNDAAHALQSDTLSQRLTYSTMGIYQAGFFASLPWGNPQGVAAPLAPLLRRAAVEGRLCGEPIAQPWTDVGTPARLAELNASTPAL